MRGLDQKALQDKTTSEVLAAGLYAAGCRHAFGIAGGEVLFLMEAMDRSGISVQLVRHENCGGFMGEGVWHATGAPAVLFATIGPGIANAANAIINAWQDRVPLIVLTGCVTALDRHTFTHQVYDHSAFLQTVSKATFRLEHGTAAIVIDKAIAMATTDRPGPVILDVPVDVQRAAQSRWDCSSSIPPSPVIPGGDALTRARDWLARARYPLVLAGLDAVNQGASGAVEAVCRQLSAPLITSYKGKGLIAEDDPLCLGGAGLSPRCDEVLLPVVRQSDCVILAGYDPIEMRTGWRNPFHAGQKVIDVSAEANRHYMHQADLNFVGDVPHSLQAMTQGISNRAHWTASGLDQVRETLDETLRVNETWGPAAVIDEARKVCPRNTVATVDSGAHRIVLSQIWKCYQPRGLLQSSALCTMGAAVPLAIGRKMAESDRPVIAFVGDAGLEMFLGELATIRDLRLSIPIVVFVDHQLALIELKQRNIPMSALGVDFGGTDFEAVAGALGGFGATVCSREALRRSIEQAWQRPSFTLISAMIGRYAYEGRI